MGPLALNETNEFLKKDCGDENDWTGLLLALIDV